MVRQERTKGRFYQTELRCVAERCMPRTGRLTSGWAREAETLIYRHRVTRMVKRSMVALCRCIYLYLSHMRKIEREKKIYRVGVDQRRYAPLPKNTHISVIGCAPGRTLVLVPREHGFNPGTQRTLEKGLQWQSSRKSAANDHAPRGGPARARALDPGDADAHRHHDDIGARDRAHASCGADSRPRVRPHGAGSGGAN